MKTEQELINEFIKDKGVTKCPEGEAFGLRPTRRQIAIAEYNSLASIDNETGRGGIGKNSRSRKGDINHRRYYVEKNLNVRTDTNREMSGDND